MKPVNVIDRLEYLAESFDIFEKDSDTDIPMAKFKALESEGYLPSFVKNITTFDSEVIAIVSNKTTTNGKTSIKISVSSEIFIDIIAADPTVNKMYSQWILSLFSNLLKIGQKKEAVRLVIEDLPQANKYLILFDKHKRKDKFKRLCDAGYSFTNLKDPSNINQYKSLAQLFDAVDPFIFKEPSVVEKILHKMVDSGQAIIPVKDRFFTLYIPKTTEASVVFNDFANWCTSKEGNGMFNSYVKNKKPNGKLSDIYIIINNDFFTGKSDEIYQIHFESGQIKDRLNSGNVSILNSVIEKSEGIKNFFIEELVGMAKDCSQSITTNKYLRYLTKFGCSDKIFEILDYKTPTIKIIGMEIPTLPNLTKFTNLKQIILLSNRIEAIHPSIGEIKSLEVLIIAENNITELPREIGNLKNLLFLNITKNKIKSIPSDITYLDKSNGGSLDRIAVTAEDIGEENIKKLKQLLPTTTIG